MSNKTMSQKKLIIRIITSPYKAICKARDFYIRSITSCADHATYGGSAITQLPRTTSSSSSCDEDLKELIRANSTARNLNRSDLDLYIKQHMMLKQSSSPAPMASHSNSRRVPRSASVGMGRIDEDAPVASFSDDIGGGSGRKVKSDHLMFPRSKSHAAPAKINRFS